MLPTREDAERLAEAIRGQGLLEVLKALQNFELKVEDIASLDTDVAMVIATSTMFIAGELATKLESPSNKEANQFAEPLNNLYNRRHGQGLRGFADAGERRREQAQAPQEAPQDGIETRAVLLQTERLARQGQDASRNWSVQNAAWQH